ncbi:MAG TPA: DUF393 domain-containing protein [Fimbriimonas sp.]|nr:DUF393 domain-containing protein [Fimbriimonas sp.]
MANWILYYDGGCNLCHSSQLRLEKWAQNRSQPLLVDILQSEAAISKGYGLDGMVLEVDGHPYIGYEAWLETLCVAPWPLRWIYPIRHLAIVRWISKIGYGIVAKYRLKWFGTRACQIPERKS